jgi:hypothetical protein
MRWTVCLITILLYGCQGVSVLEQPTENALIPIMPLWERYKQCQRSTNPEELVLILEQFERTTLTGIEPPAWMRALGRHVTSQPSRIAVDPKALGAACMLRAAALFSDVGRLPEARALYQRTIAQYSSSEWAYYVDQAKKALVNLPEFAPAIVALRTNPRTSH